MNNDTTVRVPQQARSIDKRNRLVDAAMALFGEKGFQGTNAKEIAGKAGVSVGTFYAYFTDKKALLLEILSRHMADVDAAVFEELRAMVRDGATGREMMRLTIRLGHDSHHHAPELLRIMLAMRYTDEDFTRMVTVENRDMTAKIVGLLSAMGDNLRVTDLEAAAQVVANAFEETMHSVAVFGSDIKQDRLYEALADMTAVYLFKDPDAPLK
jgi:AcrR family transcriptional regulator